MPVTLERHTEKVYGLEEVQKALLKIYGVDVPMLVILYRYRISPSLEGASLCRAKGGQMKRVKESELFKFCKEIISAYVLTLQKKVKK